MLDYFSPSLVLQVRNINLLGIWSCKSQRRAPISSTMPSSEEKNQSRHVVMFPFMAQGHIIPFLQLSKLLAARTGFTITIVNTPLNIQAFKPRIESARQADSALDISFAELPFSSADHGLPPRSENTDSLPYSFILPLLQASEHLKPHFENLIRRICQQDGRPPLCIISDMFLGWTLDVADMFGIPRIVFYTCGAYGTLLYNSLWTHLPQTKTDSDEFTLPDFPHVSLHRSQLPANMKMATGSDGWSLFQFRQMSRNMRSWGFIFNTFEELEHGYLEHMRKSSGKSVWAVGPLLPSRFLSSSPQSYANSGQLLRGKETESDALACLHWLDSNKPFSVLYVSFGTQNTISARNMKELALGLESCGQPFIWVVRPPLGVPVTTEFSPEFLPDGFEERVKSKNQGLIVKAWAPQLLILSHRSTGGFLSHCGWNSTLESLSQGVPMIGWPMAGEQFFNSKFLEEEVGVCLEICRGSDGELTKEKVEKTVKMLMTEERGSRIRESAVGMRNAARKAVMERDQEGGSSGRDVDDIIQELTAAQVQ